MLFFFVYTLYSTNPKNIYLLLLICITASVCLTRYIGIILIFVGIISILRVSGHFKKISHLVCFSIFSSLPITAWLIKNMLISGTFTGTRQYSEHTIFENIHSLLVNLFSWFFSDQIKSNRILLLVIGLILCILIGFYIRNLISKKITISSIQSVLVIFTLVYIISLLASSISSFWQLIDNRYLSPVFIPITLLIFIFADDVLIIMQEQHSLKFILPVIILILTISITYSGKNTLKNSQELASYRLGFNTQANLQSETTEYLIKNPSVVDNCKVYTNNPIAISFVAYFPAETSPGREVNYLTSIVTDDITKLDDSWITQRSCLIWFHSDSRYILYSLNDLKKIIRLDLMYSFNDGAIYAIEKK